MLNHQVIYYLASEIGILTIRRVSATTLARFCDFGVNPSVLYCVCSKLCQGDTSNTILRGGVILFPVIWAVQEGRLWEQPLHIFSITGGITSEKT